MRKTLPQDLLVGSPLNIAKGTCVRAMYPNLQANGMFLNDIKYDSLL